MSGLFKLILAVILVVFLLGFVFSFLFKAGVLLLIGLGVLYLFKKVFGNT